jgi:hypothetical protein
MPKDVLQTGTEYDPSERRLVLQLTWPMSAVALHQLHSSDVGNGHTKVGPARHRLRNVPSQLKYSTAVLRLDRRGREQTYTLSRVLNWVIVKNQTGGFGFFDLRSTEHVTVRIQTFQWQKVRL